MIWIHAKSIWPGVRALPVAAGAEELKPAGTYTQKSGSSPADRRDLPRR